MFVYDWIWLNVSEDIISPDLVYPMALDINNNDQL